MSDAQGEPTRDLHDACRMLGKIVVAQQRTMRAAQIEMAQNGPHKAMQWILNSLPDVYDGLEWDGKESATAWLDRVEAADRAGETDG